MLKEKPEDFWKNGTAFYSDSRNFVHKINPQDQVMAPKARIRRGKNEGLKFTSKEKKVGHGGKVGHFMVAISFNKAVVVCEQNE